MANERNIPELLLPNSNDNASRAAFKKLLISLINIDSNIEAFISSTKEFISVFSTLRKADYNVNSPIYNDSKFETFMSIQSDLRSSIKSYDSLQDQQSLQDEKTPEASQLVQSFKSLQSKLTPFFNLQYVQHNFYSEFENFMLFQSRLIKCLDLKDEQINFFRTLLATFNHIESEELKAYRVFLQFLTDGLNKHNENLDISFFVDTIELTIDEKQQAIGISDSYDLKLLEDQGWMEAYYFDWINEFIHKILAYLVNLPSPVENEKITLARKLVVTAKDLLSSAIFRQMPPAFRMIKLISLANMMIPETDQELRTALNEMIQYTPYLEPSINSYQAISDSVNTFFNYETNLISRKILSKYKPIDSISEQQQARYESVIALQQQKLSALEGKPNSSGYTIKRSKIDVILGWFLNLFVKKDKLKQHAAKSENTPISKPQINWQWFRKTCGLEATEQQVTSSVTPIQTSIN